MLALKKGPYMLIFKKKAIFPTVHWPVTGAPKLSLDLTDSIVQICYANLPHSITYYSVDLISKSQLVGGWLDEVPGPPPTVRFARCAFIFRCWDIVVEI
jgi:hypothetical protein